MGGRHSFDERHSLQKLKPVLTLGENFLSTAKGVDPASTLEKGECRRLGRMQAGFWGVEGKG